MIFFLRFVHIRSSRVANRREMFLQSNAGSKMRFCQSAVTLPQFQHVEKENDALHFASQSHLSWVTIAILGLGPHNGRVLTSHRLGIDIFFAINSPLEVSPQIIINRA